jgi:hypothetical protein
MRPDPTLGARRVSRVPKAQPQLSLEWFKKYASERGGRCLTGKYRNAWSPLTFECRNGHRWTTVARNLRRGSWCHVCGGSNPLTLEAFQSIALERGGNCLSKRYRNQRQKLKFRCANGHVFGKEASAVKNTSQWCPECAQNTGERICRVAFETLFKNKFPTAWPQWLRNSRNQPMELDGYSDELKIGFEHQGEQHYSTRTHWITSTRKLERRRKDDRRKYYLARQNGVHLFRIPQVPYRISPGKLIPYIARRAIKAGIEVPTRWQNLKIDFNRVYSGDAKERLANCRSLAAERGGEFLSTDWQGEEAYYTWRCARGHQWNTKVRSIRRGNWCGICSGKAKLTLALFRKIAKGKGGECLSERYISAHENLKFKCKEGHIFYSSGSNVKNLGRWCAECSGKKRHTLKQMQEIAEQRKGKCLSGEYKNNKIKLLWKCEKGHQWQATPHKILLGQWCPMCSRKKIWITRRAAVGTVVDYRDKPR